MKINKTLPEGYEKTCSLDFMNDKKLKLGVNTFAGAFSCLGTIAVLFIAGITNVFDYSGGIFRGAVLPILIIAGVCIVYFALNEVFRLIVLKALGAGNAKMGLNSLYVYTSDKGEYMDRGALTAVNCIPFIIWTVIIVLLLLLLPARFKWTAGIAAVAHIVNNCSGYFILLKAKKQPASVLIEDGGTEIGFFNRG